MSIKTKKTKALSGVELARMGGTATFKKHGKKFFQKIAMKRHHPEEYKKKYGSK